MASFEWESQAVVRSEEILEIPQVTVQISCRGLCSAEIRWVSVKASCFAASVANPSLLSGAVLPGDNDSIGGSKDLMFEFLTENSASPAVPISYMLLRLVVTGRTGPKGAWWWYIVACSAVSPAWFMFWIVYDVGDACSRRWSYLGSLMFDKLTIW